MKKLLFIAPLAFATLSFGECYQRSFDGYSAIGVGVQSFVYQEVGEISGIKFKSESKATNPVYISRTLVKVNNGLDFSIDAVSTLVPQEADETYRDRETGKVLQTNKSEMITSKLDFLLHYKFTKQFRFLTGMGYTLNSFSRSVLVDGVIINGKTKKDMYYLTKENSASTVLNVGFWYESNTAALKGVRYKLKATYGFPIWQKTTNSAFPNVEFHEKEGRDYTLTAYLGYTLTKGVEVGLTSSYVYMYRKGGAKENVLGADGERHNILWPKNYTKQWNNALMFVWNFK